MKVFQRPPVLARMSVLRRRYQLSSLTTKNKYHFMPSTTTRPMSSSASEALLRNIVSLNNMTYKATSMLDEMYNIHTINSRFSHRRMFSTVPAGACTDDDNYDDDDDESLFSNDNDSVSHIRNRSGVRNIAIIAHVDHGKTTLVDQLLRSAANTKKNNVLKKEIDTSSSGSNNEDSNMVNNANSDAGTTDRLLDCGDLEKERGITITSKVTRIDEYYATTGATHDEVNSVTSNKPTIINLVDTPGHADFCGEVDRVLSLVDGVCLVVDAGEGPMAQTKYVLSRALQAQLPIVVVLNKVDRRISFDRVVEGDTEISLECLMEQLGAASEQIRFSLDDAMFYASARDGWITQDLDTLRDIVEGNSNDNNTNDNNTAMTVLLDRLLELIPEPSVRVYDDNKVNNNTSKIAAAAGKDVLVDDGSVSPSKSVSSSSSISGECFVDDKFSLAAVTVGHDPYLGRTCTGRITSGHVTANDTVTVLRRRDNSTLNADVDDGDANDDHFNTTNTPTTSLKGLFVNQGIVRVPLESKIAYAGDIVTLAGVPDSINVGDTITGIKSSTDSDGNDRNRRVERPIDTPPLVPPTLSMEFSANNGPLAGTDGTEVTPSKLRNRLIAETDNNVTLNVEPSANDSERTNVYARGELQLGILIEQMRREGFEMVISPPSIVTKAIVDEDKGGKVTLMEPFEEVTIDVDSEYTGYIVSALTSDRKGILLEMNESPSSEGDSKTRLVFEVPSRGLLGFPSEAASATRGSAVVNHVYIEDRKYAGLLGLGLEKGKLISSDSGKATTHALSSLAARGTLFIGSGDLVYPGMIIGESAKQGDLEVNPVRAKVQTNMRTQNKDEKQVLAPPKRMTVEEMIGYMASDEMIEVTPNSLRLRKAELDPSERRRLTRTKKKQHDSLKKK